MTHWGWCPVKQNEAKTGCATVYKKKEIQNICPPSKKKQKTASIFNAEVCAISVAFDFISRKKKENDVIFSDSLSVITAIKKKY